MSYTKKLIEVALPLDIINDASAYDKMPGIGAHPKGIHYYPARLPLPSARAILFSSLVLSPVITATSKQDKTIPLPLYSFADKLSAKADFWVISVDFRVA